MCFKFQTHKFFQLKQKLFMLQNKVSCLRQLTISKKFKFFTYNKGGFSYLQEKIQIKFYMQAKSLLNLTRLMFRQ